MSDVAIRVENLSKQYTLGPTIRHDRLKDFLTHGLNGLFRRLRSPIFGPMSSDGSRSNYIWALKDLSFEVNKGEALGVIGANGAGKSTLLKILSRITEPTCGRAEIFGRAGTLLEVGTGFDRELTGRENVYLNGAILGMTKREIDQRFDEIVDFSGVERYIDTPVKRYSSGMYVRLAFAVAAHLKPEILLIDEVLSVGDAAFREKCVQHMKTLVRSDVSVVFISHNLQQVRQLCDRCLVLDWGVLRYNGEVDNAFEQYLECIRNRPGDKDIYTLGAGRLGSISISDQEGNECWEIQSHNLIRIHASYELSTDLPGVGMEINFYKSDGRFICSCNSKEDLEELPAKKGLHNISIDIPYLPFSQGEYFIGVRLVEVASGKLIDGHDRRYMLRVRGSRLSPNAIYLNPEWVHGGPCDL